MAVPVDPRTTSRAQAFALWMQAPMPMVTLLKTLDVTRLVRAARRRGWKLNMLLCWCIGRAAAQVKEFYLLPVGEQLMQWWRWGTGPSRPATCRCASRWNSSRRNTTA